MAVQKEEVKQPGLPDAIVKIEEKPALWIMYFRQGNDPKKEKIFAFNDSLVDARIRAQAHCTAMGYIFNFVKPFISDLDWEEDRRKSS